MWRKTRGISALLALIVGMTACYGSFNLTRKLYNWQGSPDDKWIQEGYFLVTGVLLPVYTITILADALVFNSIEFWSGENPVETASGDDDGVQIGEAELNGERVEVELRAKEGGEQYLTLTHTVDGQIERILNVVREGNETHVLDAAGNRVMTASHLSDGGMLIQGLDGGTLSFVGGAEVQDFLAGLATGEAVPSRFAARHLRASPGVAAQ